MSDADAFVIHRLRAKPVTYTATISHFVQAGEWVMGISLGDIGDMDEEQRGRIAADLRAAADLVESADWEQTA